MESSSPVLGPLCCDCFSISRNMFPKANGLSSLFSAVFKRTSDINDLYSIYDEIGGIIIIITRVDKFDTGELRMSVVGLFKNFFAFVDKL